MGWVIRAEDLTKFYGRNRGVQGLTLDVGPGEVFGFLGPNGAGKTTTIRLLLDLIRPTRGRLEVLGTDPREGGARLRRRIGYLPGELRLWERLTGGQLVTFLAGLRGMRDLRYPWRLAERLGLDLSRPVRELSKGNKQKVGLVQALMHRPELLVLDEPTSGLDPLVQQEFQALMRETTEAGATVFLSSHVLGEVQEVADRVGIIRDGRLVAVEDVDALRARAGTRVSLRFADPVPANEFAGLAGVHDVTADGPLLLCVVEGEVDPLVRAAARHHVVALTSTEADLEDVFLSYYREGERDAA
jgi:beta-exotoxin I transport system ATP-binding protein